MPADFVMLPQGSPELARAWHRLGQIVAREDGRPFVPCTAPAACDDRCSLVERCPDTGEAWQYHGTAPDPATRGAYVHSFRHRNHPHTKARRYVHVPALTGWAPWQPIRGTR